MEVKEIIGSKYQVIEVLKDTDHCQVGVCINVYLKNKWLIKHVALVDQQAPRGLEILLALEIRGVPRVIDVIYTKGGCYYIMEYIRGVTLLEAMDNRRTPEEKYMKWGLHLSSIIESIHSLNIIHGDIKPSNVMVLEDDSVVLIDFDSSFTTLDSRAYSLDYVAPERLLDQCAIDERSDLYSLGLVYKDMSEAFHCKSRKFKKLIRALTAVDPSDRLAAAYMVSDILNSYS